MTDSFDVVALLSGGLIQQLDWAGPEVTEAVLTAAASVPYQGDVYGYVEAVLPVIAEALAAAMRPRFAALEAHIAETEARIATLEAEHQRFLREFVQFRRLKTPKQIQ